MTDQLPPPSTIRVGACDWRVTVAADAKLFGKTRHKATEILLCEQSPASMRDSLIHEVLHAVWWCAGGEKLLDIDKDAEERLIRLLSPWLLSLIRDNPHLVAYLVNDPSKEQR